MPKPSKGESQGDFLERCIPMVMEDGTAADNKQAVAICSSIFEDEGKKEQAGKGEVEKKAIPVDDESIGMLDHPVYVPYGVTSFEEMFEVLKIQQKGRTLRELTYVFNDMASNIMSSDQIEDKIAAIRSLTAEFTALVDEISTKEAEQPESIWQAIKGIFKAKPAKDEPVQRDDVPDSVKERFSFLVWKNAQGVYNWVARYSNNLRDDDKPPEIIAGESHKNFVKMVDEGEAPLPELWLWHNPQWRLGKAKWVAVDEREDGTVWALAGGTFYKEAEAIAEQMSQLEPDKIAVSHGMPSNSIRRKEEDTSILLQHITAEISPLVRGKEANRWTSFIVHKDALIGGDETMTILEEKREQLEEEWKVDPSLLDALESANEGDAQKAAELGIEKKEQADAVEEAVDAAEVAPEPEADEDAPKAAVKEQPEYVTAEVLTATLKAIIQPMMDGLNALKQMAEQNSEAIGQMQTEKKETQEKIDELTPAASMAQSIIGSVIGSPDAFVDGRTKLAKSKPVEVAHQEQSGPHGIPLLNALLTGQDWRDAMGIGES